MNIKGNNYTNEEIKALYQLALESSVEDTKEKTPIVKSDSIEERYLINGFDLGYDIAYQDLKKIDRKGYRAGLKRGAKVAVSKCVLAASLAAALSV